ncbi:MAG: tetratricopeptide repeat protein, partial [Rhodospirillales bacterium]|nr:tetratricopeptide repeat protein [Rhodospirillales bacterium]
MARFLPGLFGRKKTAATPSPAQAGALLPALSTLACIGFFAACTSAQVSDPVLAADTAPVGRDAVRFGEPVDVGSSFVGNYLAGRHAYERREGARAIEYFQKSLDLDPAHQDLLLRAAILLVSEGRVHEALSLMDRLEESAESSVIFFAQAVHDIHDGHFDRAASRLQDMPENGVNQFVGPLLHAWALAGKGETELAIKVLAVIKNDKGDNALHNLHAALINDLGGRQTEARASFEAALKTEQGPPLRVAELFGEFLERAGEPEEARRVYDDFLSHHPDSELLDTALERLKTGARPGRDIASASDGAAQALFDLAGAFRQRNVQDLGLVLGRLTLHLKPDFPAAQILLANILEGSQRPEEANRVYGAINPASPFSWAARVRMALNYDDLDDPEQAMAHLRDLAAERPGKAEPLITMGNILRSRNRFEEAVGVFDEAFRRIDKLEPRHWSLLYSRGMALERSKQWDRAEKDFLKALEFEPEQPYVLNYLGYSWVDQGLHLERAMDMIEKAVSLRPNDGYIVDSLGWAHYRLGNMERAVVEL